MFALSKHDEAHGGYGAHSREEDVPMGSANDTLDNCGSAHMHDFG
jgi:hypothetical protein